MDSSGVGSQLRQSFIFRYQPSVLEYRGRGTDLFTLSNSCGFGGAIWLAALFDLYRRIGGRSSRAFERSLGQHWRIASFVVLRTSVHLLV